MPKLTEQEILEKVKQFRADGLSGSDNLYERMRKSEDFVIGGDLQWDPTVKEHNTNKGKFSLTIPIVKPQIKHISGSEIQNPQDFIIENTQGGAASIALILTALVKQAADSERVKFEKSQMFESGLSSGQGVMGVFIDKSEDPKHANLRIEKLNEHNVMVDPNATSYNINKLTSGAKYVIWEDWIDKEFVEVEYPDKAEELKASGSQSFLGVVTGNIVGIINFLVGHKDKRSTGSFGDNERTEVDVMVKTRYLKSHTWWREPKKCVHWYDSRESELESKFLSDDKEIALAKKATKEAEEAAKAQQQQIITQAAQAGVEIRDPRVQQALKEAGTPVFSIEEVDSFVIHHTISVGDIFLEDRVDELNGVRMYPLNFFWPYWVNGYKSGLAEDLIGVQEEINWTHSMAMNLVKQVANSGYIINEDSGGDYVDWLKTHGGEDGVVLDKSKAGGNIERIESPKIPAMEVFTQAALENARRITGIRTEAPETDRAQLSGRAIFLKQQSSQQGSQSVFLNWNYTLAIMGDLLVDIIRKNDIFSEDEIRAIVDKNDLINEELMNLAKNIVMEQVQKMGGEILSPPEAPNPIRMQNAEPEFQARTLEIYQQQMAAFEQFVNMIEQHAIPIAEELMIKLIHSMKIGKYNTKVTTSPMSETMRAVKATETFGLQKLLRESGDIGLDGDDLIEATDVPNKEQLKLGRQKLLTTVQQAKAEPPAKTRSA